MAAEINGAAPPWEDNPYLDGVENDPILWICLGLYPEQKKPKPPSKKKPSMGWEEYKRRQSAARRKGRHDAVE